MMGITGFPYHACQEVTGDKSIALGDWLDSNNPFAWYKVVLKFPGSEECDYHRPWLFEQRVGELLDTDLFIHVEDGQPIGPTEDLCWEASRRWGTTCYWLGIKDASRKVQPSPQETGIWDGTVTNTEGGVHRLVYQEMWDKNWRLI